MWVENSISQTYSAGEKEDFYQYDMTSINYKCHGNKVVICYSSYYNRHSLLLSTPVAQLEE